MILELNYNNGYDNGYLIKDKKDNKYMFTAAGYLYKIEDNNKNLMKLQYQGSKLKYIEDGVGRRTTLDLLDNGYLVGIIDSSGKRTSFGYKGIQLSTILYPDKKISTINYDTNDKLIEAQNYDGYKVRYEYSSGVDAKVIKSYEVFNDGTTGKSLIMNYGYNTTSFKDLQGRKEVYQFNNWDNTTSVIDDNGSGTYYKYGEIDNTTNKLLSNSKLQNTITNYLLNHNCEVTNTQWSYDYWGNSQGIGEFTTEEKYLGNNSLKIIKNNIDSRSFLNQSTVLEKGKTYTFSAYVKSKNLSSTLKKGAGIFVNYQNKDGSYSTVESEFLQGTSNWERLSVTFTLPSDAASNSVYLRAGIIEGTGIAYIDSLQVEEGITSNRYNLVENPSFKVDGNQASSIYWSATSYDSSNALLISNDSTYPSKIDNSKTVYKMGGFSNKSKNIYQLIPISGKKGDVFVAAGWARGESVPLRSDRYFALDIGIQRVDGSYQWYVIPFNQDTEEWQYAADKVIADSDYKSIAIYGLYYNNVNNVYFDNFQLYKEEFSTSYQYDSKGNILSTKDLDEKNSNFQYNGSSDLIKAIDPKGNNYNYSYDDKHNIKTATSAENVVYSFTYDTYGNPIKAVITGGAMVTSSEAAYTSDGNYIRSITDEMGNKTTYYYDDETPGNFNNKIISKGNITSITDAKDTSIFYNYDSNTNVLTKAYKNVDGKEISNSYTYENDKLKTINHNGFNYTFNYDKAGNNSEVLVGNQKLITNNYNLLTGNLDSSTYGNGHTVTYQYDRLDRIIGKKFNGDTQNRYSYNYDANGNLALQKDNTTGTSTRYFYDLSDRLSKITDSNNNIFKVNYDLNNNISDFEEQYSNFNKFKTSYTYDKDNKIKSIVYNSAELTSSNSELFLLNGNLLGSLGTKPYSSSPIYEKDSDGNVNLASFNKGNNLILNNSSFESDSSNWNLSDWNGLGGNWRVVNDGEFGVKALESYSSNSDSSINTNAVAYQDITLPSVLTSSKSYTISAYAKRLGAAVPKLSIQCLDSSNKDIPGAYWTYSKNIAENQWTKIYETVTIPKNTAKIRVIVRTSVKGSEKVRFDAVQLEESIYSTPYEMTLTAPSAQLYSLGINKNSGAQGTWMLTKDTGKALMVLGNENTGNSGILNLYIDSDNKVKISARNTNNDFYNIVQSNVTITKNKWYYTAMSWQTNTNGTINITLYVYDKEGNKLDKVSGALTSFKDIVGGSTSLGSSVPNRYKLNGYLKGFTYSSNKLTDAQITNLYSKGQTTNIQYNYDLLGRLNRKSINTGSATYNTSLEYIKNYTNKETNLVSGYTNGSKKIQYSYDALKNIKSIVENSKTKTFTYNDLNELVREDNGSLNKTITYEYDAGGNILFKKEYGYTTGALGNPTKTINYAYGDSNWKDKLTAYDGKTITYDEIGNPLTYDGYTYTWEGGRRLKAITGNNKNISYKYNDSGIRTEKTVNGVTTTYTLSGSSVLLETTSNEKIHYTYDSSCNLISMNIISDSNPSINGEYYYIRNLQGDIIGLIDKNGTEVVSYTYDTWGKLISIEGSLKDTVGVKNPYRYRGYRFDTETGLYYLNARYYNPDWGRFINADGIIGTPGELLSGNMFAYCGNDPVNREDSSGYLWGFIKTFISEIANVFNAFRPIYAGAGGAALVDGPLPIGDLVGLVIASVATIAVVGIATYNTITYSSKSNSDDTKSENPSNDKSSGRSKNKLVPNVDAKGDHTTFKHNPETGEITNYETWKVNPRNPSGFDRQKRYDGKGKPHTNPITGEKLMPHIHDKNVPGGVRSPMPWEIPGGAR